MASFYYYYVFFEIPVSNVNSVDPAQMNSVASDLGLHCLPILGIYPPKWVMMMTELVFYIPFNITEVVLR